MLDQEYQKLFGPNGNVPTDISSYDIDVQRFVDFRRARNVPEAENVDHFALLLLTASWLEDNTESLSAQQDLSGDFLLPCAAKISYPSRNLCNTSFLSFIGVFNP